jgi:hypothetical protein
MTQAQREAVRRDLERLSIQPRKDMERLIRIFERGLTRS